MSKRSKRKIRVSDLGPSAKQQLVEMGYDVGAISSKEAEAGTKRRNKYNVSPPEERTLDGILFDSKFEMRAYKFLKDAGYKFDMQVEYVLIESFRFKGKTYRKTAYVADFVFSHHDKEDLIVDTKGKETEMFRLKKKMMAQRGLEVVCVRTVSALKKKLDQYYETAS